MRRLILFLIAFGVIFTSQVLGADVTTKTKRSSTNKIELSGEIGLQAAFREDFFDRLHPRRGNVATWTRTHGEIFGRPQMSLNLEAKLKDELGAVVKISLVPGTYGAETPQFGAKDSFLYVEEVYAYSKEFLGKYTNLYVGEKNVKIDLRDNGDEFFCNVMESENPFTGAVHTDPALTGISASVSGTYTPALGGLGVPTGASAGGMFWNGYLGGNAWWNNYAGQAKHSAFAGGQIEWVASRLKTGMEPFKFEFAMGMVLETQMAQTDTVLFLGRPVITFDATGTHKHWSRIHAILSVISGDDDTAIGTVGVGASIKPLPFLEVFGEYMGQFGEYTAAQRNPGHDRIDHEGHAAYLGVRVEPKFELGKAGAENKLSLVPFAEASVWFVSGDRGDPDEKNTDFVSFEDVDTFLIMEDNEFGLDVDCNYKAFKSEIGLRFETVELALRYGVFYANFAPNQDVYGTHPDGKAHFDKLMGNELDVRLSFRIKEGVKANLVGAFMWDGYFWDQTFRARGLGINPTDGTGTNAAMAMAELALEF